MDVAQAVIRLRRRRSPTVREAAEVLGLVRQVIACTHILSDVELFGEGTFSDLVAGWSSPGDDVLYDFCMGTLRNITEVAPLDDEAIEIDLEDGQTPYYLPPTLEGYPMDWDGWDEVTRELSGQGDGMQIFVFFTALGFHDSETLFAANEEWGWELKRFPNFEKVTGLDPEKFYAELTRQNLAHFINAFEVCTYQTGNVYFDYNSYDECEINLPEFDLDGVRRLRSAWLEARPIIADKERAQEEFYRVPGLPAKLMDIYFSALVFDPRVRPQTLAEMWAQDAREEQGDNDGTTDDDE